MLQIVNRWKVLARFENGREIEFWIDENHLSNVLNQISRLKFTANALAPSGKQK